MAKTALKRRIIVEQEGACALSDVTLPARLALVDTDRIQPKAVGGIYSDVNTRIVTPRAHMARHGTLRERPVLLDRLKSVFDDRVQVMRLMLKINNQLLAYERRTDDAHPETAAFLTAQTEGIETRLHQIDVELSALIKQMALVDPLVRAAMGVKGVGPVTVAALTVYTEVGGIYTDDDRAVKEGKKQAGGEKAPCASSLWSYVGYDKPSHERYEKGVAGGGNKTLRTVLYNTACSLMKGTGPYRDVYDRTKSRLAASERLVKSRNTAGKLVEVMWKDAKPSHRHGAALRAVAKHLLADYWFVGRSVAGLSTRPLYVEEKLGHTGIIKPTERGWIW